MLISVLPILSSIAGTSEITRLFLSKMNSLYQESVRNKAAENRSSLKVRCTFVGTLNDRVYGKVPMIRINSVWNIWPEPSF